MGAGGGGRGAGGGGRGAEGGGRDIVASLFCKSTIRDSWYVFILTIVVPGSEIFALFYSHNEYTN